MVCVGSDGNATDVVLSTSMYSDGTLRVDTVSENLPISAIKYYEYRSGNSYAELSNVAGRFFYFPPVTAPGDVKSSIGWNVGDFPVRVLYSNHFSPHQVFFPAVAKDSSGNVGTAYCDYTDGVLSPFEYTDNINPALHNLQYTGFGVSLDVAPGGERRVIVSDSPSAHRNTGSILMAFSWFLLRVDGSVTFPSRPIKYWVKCMVSGGGSAENVCSQTAKITKMLESGNSKYYLVQTDGLQYLQQDNPYSQQWPQAMWNLEYIDQAMLAVTLAKGSAVSVVGWGMAEWVKTFL